MSVNNGAHLLAIRKINLGVECVVNAACISIMSSSVACRGRLALYLGLPSLCTDNLTVSRALGF